MGIHVDVLSSTVVRGGKAGELSCEKVGARLLFAGKRINSILGRAPY
jgi:hypothetical protein